MAYVAVVIGLRGGTKCDSGAKAVGVTATRNGGSRSCRRWLSSLSLLVVVIDHMVVGASSTLVVEVAVVLTPSTLV